MTLPLRRALPTGANSRFKKTFCNLFLLLLFQLGAVVFVSAQENILKDIVPPPLSIISKGEDEQLNSQKDLKKRTALALDFMEGRLIKAEKFSTDKKFRESLDELGGFQAVMQNTVGYLKKSNAERGKILSNFKRFEITLRGFVPRLELVRRTMPEKFGYHVMQLLKIVRRARTTAVEPFFDNRVVPDNR